MVVECVCSIDGLFVSLFVFSWLDVLVIDRLIHSLGIHEFTLAEDAIVVSVTHHYFLLLSIYCAAYFGFAWNLIVRNHLNLFHNRLVLQNFLCQCLCLSIGWWFSAILRLATCLERCVQISTTVQVSSLKHNQVVRLVMFCIKACAVLLNRFDGALRVNSLHLSFLWLRVLILVFVGCLLTCTWRLCHLIVGYEVGTAGGLVTLRVLFVNDLVGQINHFHTFATCTGRWLLNLATLNKSLRVYLSHFLNGCQQLHLVCRQYWWVTDRLSCNISVCCVAAALFQNY